LWIGSCAIQTGQGSLKMKQYNQLSFPASRPILRGQSASSCRAARADSRADARQIILEAGPRAPLGRGLPHRSRARFRAHHRRTRIVLPRLDPVAPRTIAGLQPAGTFTAEGRPSAVRRLWHTLAQSPQPGGVEPRAVAADRWDAPGRGTAGPLDLFDGTPIPDIKSFQMYTDECEVLDLHGKDFDLSCLDD
jgi:hypothetical protein